MLSRTALQTWVRRPVVLAATTTTALALLLGGGLVVARAVDGPSDPATTAASTGNGDSNTAVASNTGDGKTVYAIRLKIVQTAKDTVDSTNAAVAAASCTDCTTVAIAFEGVLVAGSPSTFDPTNLAIAYNQDCSGCQTFADAYQQVVQSSTRVRITGEGRRKVAAIRKDLEMLRTENLSFEEIIARVKADEQAFADVLLHDCVPVGHVKDPAATDAADVSDSPSAVAPDPSASSTTPDPTPSDTGTATPTPTDSPGETPTPTATPS